MKTAISTRNRYGLLALSLAMVVAACGGGAPPPAAPAAAPAAPVAPAAAPATDAAATAAPGAPLGPLAWDNLFDTVEGWYDANKDPGLGARFSAEAGGLAKLTECGTDVWGKALIIVPNIDFSRGPVFTVVVNKVEEGADYKVLAVANPWSDADMHEIIPSSTATGEVRGDLASTGWTGVKKDFNLVLVVGGNNKSVTFDSLHINYTK